MNVYSKPIARTMQQLRDENEALRACLQDLCTMILYGRNTREDEPVRRPTLNLFLKAMAKAHAHFDRRARRKSG